MKRVALIAIAVLISTAAHGQVVDSTSVNGQGMILTVSGKGMILTGAVTAAAGGGLMLLAVSPLVNKDVPENMLLPIVLTGGISCVIAGAAAILAGIPVTIAGHSITGCDVPWRDARLRQPGCRDNP